MKTNYVLIDYENVQPTDMGLLRDGPFKVRLFLGPNQSRIPVSLATALQALGRDAEYVVLEAAGSNALDFHIAYYVGVLSAHEPSAFFHIISKDKGFDPLIQHLKGKGVLAQRSTRIADIPPLKPDLHATSDEQTEAAIAYLVRLKAAKPRTQKTLLGTLHVLFKKELSEGQLSALFASLRKRGVVTIEGTKLSYNLPTVP
jgi:PIN domain